MAAGQKLIELVPQMVVVHDAQGGVVWVNQQFREYAGDVDPHMVGALKGSAALLHPDNAARITQDVTAVGLVQQLLVPVEVRLRAGNGSYRYFQIQTRSVFDVDGKIVQWITSCTDVHDRKIAEERMLALQKLEAIGQLTGGLAHDFNNMLALVIGNLDLVQEAELTQSNVKRIEVADGPGPQAAPASQGGGDWWRIAEHAALAAKCPGR